MARHSIYDALEGRILVLDGAMGTMVQRYGLVEKDFSVSGMVASMEELYARLAR